MWKRVHLATIAGPDPGCVIELGAAGRGLPPSPPVIVGRGLFADARIADAHLSRREFTAHAGTRWGRPGVWIEREPARRRRHLRPGARFRAGASTFEVRTDAARRSLPRGELALILPLAASLGFAAMWIFPGAGPWPLIAAALLTPAAMLLRSRVGSGPLPDPAQLRRTGTAEPGAGETDPPWPVEIGNSSSARRVRPARLKISPGAVIALVGADAPGLARWVAAQLLSHYGGQESPEHPRGHAGAGFEQFELRFPNATGSVTLIAAPTPAFVPAHATAVVPVRAGHNRAVTREWYESATSRSTGAELPEVVHLGDHLPELTRLPWDRHDGGLAAPIGVAVGADGLEMAAIDLGADAPHAVIAGTTGSGKSELLTSWLCGLAARYPPAHVAMVLVDYKGGATFGALARLPHVLEVLTDLEHPYTVRALRSLRVEILRRERLLKESGSAHVAEHNARAGPLPRLLIVVDEFRVLADEYPDVLDELVRVAAQGRSLGIHVVLATQRPGGTMSPDIRANMGIRACLRVVEETDSIDLIGTAGAAELPAIPGRLLLRDDALRTVQTLWAGERGLVERIVTACAAAARDFPRLADTARPWAPPLPDRLPAPPPAEEGFFCLGVSDLPEEQRLGTWQVPAGGHVVVAGDPGTGRTSAARLAAGAVAGSGAGVHVIAPGPLLPDREAGTYAAVSDVVLCHALLTRLRAEGPDALIVDEADRLVDSLDDALGPGEGVAFLQEVLRACRRAGRFVLLTTDLPIPGWVHGGGDRIVFPPADPHHAALAGLSKDVASPGPPGRAVAIRAGTQTSIQLALPGQPTPSGQPPPERAPVPEFLLRPLPGRVDLPLDVPGPALCIGIGGDDRRRIYLPCDPGGTTVVVGNPGTGKSRFARVIAARAAALGRGGELHVVDDLHTAPAPTLDECEEALQEGRHAVVTISPDGLSTGFHPFLQRLRHSEHTIFIGQVPRSAVGFNLGIHIGSNAPGRAALRTGGRIISLQLDVCSEADGPR